MNEAEKLKSTLSSIFSRKGRDGHYTRLFENLESPQKDALLSKVQLNEGELPVIGSAESADKWLIITTERIVWRLGGKEQSLSARDVLDAVADLRKLVATGGMTMTAACRPRTAHCTPSHPGGACSTRRSPCRMATRAIPATG